MGNRSRTDVGDDDEEEWMTEDEAIMLVMEERDCSEAEAVLWLDRLKCEMPESYRSLN